jgi:Protein of unknown function (DUF3631)
VHAFLGRFIVFPSEAAHVATSLWTMHTHLISHWESTPRLALLSAEPESGKTRTLEILELLTPNAVAAVNASPAYLFRRAAGDEPPTILFDEIDTIFGPKAKENEELRAFLNAGHRRGAVAGRCVVRGATVFTEELPAYCAVALAGLGWLPETILSRSIIIRMRRRRADECVEPYRRREHAPEGEYIKQQIAKWAKSQPAEISKWPDMPAGIEDRTADVWESLLVIADLVGGEWPELARRAAVALVADSREREPSLGIRLLADIKQVMDADTLPGSVKGTSRAAECARRSAVGRHEGQADGRAWLGQKAPPVRHQAESDPGRGRNSKRLREDGLCRCLESLPAATRNITIRNKRNTTATDSPVP